MTLRSIPLSRLLTALLFAAAATAQAQFKVVGPDGSVTYTDRPPPASAGAKVQPLREVERPAAPALPLVLREPVARFPVTLYTTSACGACDRGRQLLRDRGVPFTELTANSDDDLRELQAREQTQDLPVLRLGQQRMVGLDTQEWEALLDAAAYPRRSALPPGWTPKPPAPLAAPRRLEPAARVLPPAPPVAPAPAPTPGGIRF